jgi:hypothetical protein
MTGESETEVHEKPDKRAEVALAEFNALRAEILSEASAGAATVGVGLTALAVIVGFVVKDGGDERLLLTIPVLALVVNLLQAAVHHRIIRIGTYIEVDLWPYLQKFGPDDRPPSWEESEARSGSGVIRKAMDLLSDVPAIALFSAAGVAAVIHAGHLDHTFQTVGWVCAGLSIVLPACLVGGTALMRRRIQGKKA